MFLSNIKAIIPDYIQYWGLIFNLILLLVSIWLFISVKNEKKRWNKVYDYFGNITKAINSVRYGDLTKKINKFDIPDSAENLTESLNRMIETLHDREAMVTEYQTELI